MGTPIGFTTSPSLFKNNNAQPTIASIVAVSQINVGRRFTRNHSMSPKTGALPIATTVPIATPVNRTDEKNRYWKRAIETAADTWLLSTAIFGNQFYALQAK